MRCFVHVREEGVVLSSLLGCVVATECTSQQLKGRTLLTTRRRCSAHARVRARACAYVGGWLSSGGRGRVPVLGVWAPSQCVHVTGVGASVLSPLPKQLHGISAATRHFLAVTTYYRKETSLRQFTDGNDKMTTASQFQVHVEKKQFCELKNQILYKHNCR